MRSSYWVRANPKSDGSCLYKDRRGAGTEIQRRSLYGDRGRSPGAPEAASSHQRLDSGLE